MMTEVFLSGWRFQTGNSFDSLKVKCWAHQLSRRVLFEWHSSTASIKVCWHLNLCKSGHILLLLMQYFQILFVDLKLHFLALNWFELSFWLHGCCIVVLPIAMTLTNWLLIWRIFTLSILCIFFFLRVLTLSIFIVLILIVIVHWCFPFLFHLFKSLFVLQQRKFLFNGLPKSANT